LESQLATAVREGYDPKELKLLKGDKSDARKEWFELWKERIL
jgi:hypothetical protein